MATCPECDAEVEVDELDVDRGDLVNCAECGTSLEVVGLSPVELDLPGDDDDDDEEEEGAVSELGEEAAEDGEEAEEDEEDGDKEWEE